MNLQSRRLLFAALALLLCACSTSSKKEESLDIKMRPVITTEADLEAPSNIVLEEGKALYENPAGVAPKNVMEWQTFFRPAPSSTERHELESKLKAWSGGDKASTLLQKGRVEMALGRPKAAEVSFRNALRKNAANTDVLLELALLYLKTREIAKAFSFLEELRDQINLSDEVTTSTVFRYRYTLALAYLARGDRDQAQSVLSDLVGIDKSFTPAYTALASSYIAIDKFDVAEFIAKRALDRAREHPSLHNILGLIAENKGNFVAAMNHFNKAIELGPTYAPAFVNRGNLHIRQFELDLARSDMQQAIKSDPQSIEAHISLAILYRKAKDPDKARATLEMAMTIDPENPFARYNMAILMAEELKQPVAAKRLFQEVVAGAEGLPKLKAAAASYIANLDAKLNSY